MKANLSIESAVRCIATRLGVCIGIWCAVSATPVAAKSIVRSGHDLSTTGRGSMRAAEVRGICLFCHTPHMGGGDAPAWNRYSSGTDYIPYSSSTVKAKVGQPTGASKLCLSCHDGTMALGMVRSRRKKIPFARGVVKIPKNNPANLGSDLSDDHPISFVYDTALAKENSELHHPSTLNSAVRLDSNKELQCTTCHNAHDNEHGNFLVMANYASALCITCHNKEFWASSAHRTSGATWNGSDVDPWPHTDLESVNANGCENCHKPHTAGTPERLLNFAREEDNCLSCHNGNVAKKNIKNDFSKFSTHPIFETSGIHDPTEKTIDPPRHVECFDCHNPHASRTLAAEAPRASGALAGVLGVNSEMTEVKPLNNEYELCYRCHADSPNRSGGYVNRMFPQTNTRLEFSAASASYHPVETAGKNDNVVSLLSPYTSSTLIYCTDCHNSNDGPGADGDGPSGPHGSAFAPILERQLIVQDFNPESSGSYALCYKCHSRSSILGDESFPLHNKHIVEQQTACTTCHDSHGVSQSTHLINFNLDYVTPNANGRIEFVDEGLTAGSCSLKCHNREHDQEVYPQVFPAAVPITEDVN